MIVTISLQENATIASISESLGKPPDTKLHTVVEDALVRSNDAAVARSLS
jgi:hypothetical protein